MRGILAVPLWGAFVGRRLPFPQQDGCPCLYRCYLAGSDVAAGSDVGEAWRPSCVESWGPACVETRSVRGRLDSTWSAEASPTPSVQDVLAEQAASTLRSLQANFDQTMKEAAAKMADAGAQCCHVHPPGRGRAPPCVAGATQCMMVQPAMT